MRIVSFIMSLLIFLTPLVGLADQEEIDNRRDYIDILIELYKDGISEEIGFPDLTKGLFDLEFVDLDGDGDLELVALSVENSLYDGFYISVYNKDGEMYREEISQEGQFEKSFGILNYENRNYLFKEFKKGSRKELILYDFSNKKLRSKKQLLENTEEGLYEYDRKEINPEEYSELKNKIQAGIKRRFIILRNEEATELKYLEKGKLKNNDFLELYKDIIKTYFDHEYESIRDRIGQKEEGRLLDFIGQANFHGNLSVDRPEEENFLDYLRYSYIKDWQLENPSSEDSIFIYNNKRRYLALPEEYVDGKFKDYFIHRPKLELEARDSVYSLDMPSRDYAYELHQLDDIYEIGPDIYLLLLDAYRFSPLDLLNFQYEELFKANGLDQYEYPKNIVELFKRPRSSWKADMDLEARRIESSMLLLKKTEDSYKALEYKDSSYIDRQSIDYYRDKYASEVKEEPELEKKKYREVVLVVIVAFILLVVRIAYNEKKDKKS